MSFSINDEKNIKYNDIGKKFSNIIKNEFDSKPSYTEKYVKTIVKSYNGKISTNFHNNKKPNDGPQSIFLSAILTV